MVCSYKGTDWFFILSHAQIQGKRVLVASHGWRVDIFRWKNPNPKKTKIDSIIASRRKSLRHHSSIRFLPPPPHPPLPLAPGISPLIPSSSALQSAHTNTRHMTHTALLAHRLTALHTTPALTNTTYRDLAKQRSTFQRWIPRPRRMQLSVPFPAQTGSPVQTRMQTSSHHPCLPLRAL